MRKFQWKWIALFLLLSSVCVGEEIKNARKMYSDFSRGLNTEISPHSLSDKQGDICDNVRFDKKINAISKRDEVYLYGTAGGYAINGMHRYYRSNGDEFLVVALSTLLRYTTTGTFATLQGGLTDGQRWQFVTYDDMLIGGNGYDTPVKWDGLTLIYTPDDGSRSASYLCAELGAPFAERNTGSNLTASQWYTYKMAFSDGSTFYYPDSNSNFLQTGATRQNISLTDIPLGPTGTTSRFIYRTMACDTQAKAAATTVYYKVTTLSNNTTIAWDDTVTDAVLDNDAAPTWSTVSVGTRVLPPLGDIFTIHDERVFVAGNPSSPSHVFYSEQFNPSYFTNTGYERIRPDDGDTVTFLKEQYGTLTVGKDNSIQKYYTEGSVPASDWSVSDPFSFIGCRAKNSAANSPLGIMYLSNDGLYTFNGQVSQLISETVTTEIDNILKANLSNCAGSFNDNKYYLGYTDKRIGESTNNRLLILDTLRNAYSKDDLPLNSFVIFGSGGDFGTLYSGTTGGKVYAHGAESEILSHSRKSVLDLGTADDVRIYGTEYAPYLDLGWDVTIADWTDYAATISAFPATSRIARLDTDGEYTSPVLRVDANALNLFKWNETLPPGTNATFKVRTGANATPDANWSSWSTTDYTNPAGSDISSETANTYLQYKLAFSTGDVDITPVIYTHGTYTIQVSYNKGGTTTETEIASKYRSGWSDLGYPDREKQLDTVQIYLTGSSGTLTFAYESYDGIVDGSFDIDLSDNNTYYNYNFDTHQIGKLFRWEVSDTGTTTYDIEKIVFKFNILDEI